MQSKAAAASGASDMMVDTTSASSWDVGGALASEPFLWVAGEVGGVLALEPFCPLSAR